MGQVHVSVTTGQMPYLFPYMARVGPGVVGHNIDRCTSIPDPIFPSKRKRKNSGLATRPNVKEKIAVWLHDQM